MKYSSLTSESQDNYKICEEEEYQLYFDRFIKFFPKTPFHTKYGYDKGFLQAKNRKGKRKGQPGYLFPDYLTSTVERHLDPARWARESDDTYSPFWLGLLASKWIKDNAIDIDAKEYKVADYKYKNCVRPVVSPPIAHYQMIKKVYDQFPGRVWCISSRTLGLHAWHWHKLQQLDDVHLEIKAGLEQIDCGHIEVHPMHGRCFRRPFGEDYITITPEGSLHLWQDQVNYYEHDFRTPSFEQIVREMVRVSEREYRECLYHDSSRDIEVVPSRNAEVLAWLERGCKDKSHIAIQCTHPNESQVLVERVLVPLPVEVIDDNQGFGELDLVESTNVGTSTYSMRDREWPKCVSGHCPPRFVGRRFARHRCF